jgi:hypothetical protein
MGREIRGEVRWLDDQRGEAMIQQSNNERYRPECAKRERGQAGLGVGFGDGWILRL